MIKRYHRFLQQVYSIIITKIPSIKALQIFFKVINNLISLNKLVFILLIFDIYFKITELNISSLSII